MKSLNLFLLIYFSLMTARAFSQEQVRSGLYSFPENAENAVLIAGETTHFSDMELKVRRLTDSAEKILLQDNEREQIFIVKEGEVRISVGDDTKTVGANSVAILQPNDKGSMQCMSPHAIYYTMSYVSKKAMDTDRGKAGGGSFIVDFDELEYREHDKGGIRNYFRRSTAMCSYYEMHVTNLNAGIKSHEPHTHPAAEIILMIDGKTEMEIGSEIYKGKDGDIYFVVSNVPHAIKNTGDEQCMYFAFQWE